MFCYKKDLTNRGQICEITSILQCFPWLFWIIVSRIDGPCNGPETSCSNQGYHSSQVKWIKTYNLPWYLTQFSTNPSLNNSVNAFIPTLTLIRNSVNAPIQMWLDKPPEHSAGQTQFTKLIPSTVQPLKFKRPPSCQSIITQTWLHQILTEATWSCFIQMQDSDWYSSHFQWGHETSSVNTIDANAFLLGCIN